MADGSPSRKIHEAFFDEHVEKARHRLSNRLGHKNAVLQFEAYIRASPVMTALFDKIFLQVSPENKIPDFDHLLCCMDGIFEAAPRFQIAAGEAGEPIGVPLYLLFDLLSNTDAGRDLFRMTEFNVAMKNLLDSWGSYLTTPPSNSTLTDEEEGCVIQGTLKM